MALSFFVRGKPYSKGSPAILRSRAGRPFVREKPGEIAWENSIRVLAGMARRSAAAWSVTGPMRVELEFRLPRSRKPKPDGATVPPDVDKLARAVLDALSRELYEDDRQVVELVVRKRIAAPEEHAGVHIDVSVAS